MVLEQLIAQFSAWSGQLIQTWGYLGIFLVSLVGNASIILPVPAYIVVIAAGAYLNPWLVGIAAGAGAALGELTGYGVGFGGGKIIEKKHRKLLEKSKAWAEKHGMFALLVLFAATPLPDDVVGLLAGVIKYNVKRFLAATFMGKVISHAVLAWTGAFGSYLLGGWNFVFILTVSFLFVMVLYSLVYRTIREGMK